MQKSFFKRTMFLILAALSFFTAGPFFNASVFSEENNFPKHDLSSIRPDWYIVTGGNPLCAPVNTSYGFICLTEGKLLSAITHDGKLLWQRSYSFNVKPYLSTGLSDLIFLVSGKDSRTLTFLNPSGGLIKHVENPFEITSAPVQGKDGRVFVYGSQKAACYGLNGKRKWIYEFDSSLDSSLKPVELNDGSQLFFLTKTIDDKTTGVRLSAFGQVFENITFAAKIKSYSPCRDGILLEFTDGSAGYCKVEKNTLESKWIFEQKNNISAVCGNMYSSYPCVFTKDNSRLNFIREKDGSTVSSVLLEGYSSSDRLNIAETDEGFFVYNSSKGSYVYKEKTVYECTYDKSLNYTYMIPPVDGNIVFLNSDWSIKGWKLKQKIGVKKGTKKPAMRSASYFDIEQKVRKRQVAELSSSWVTGPAADDKLIRQIEKAYTTGIIGEKEYDYYSLLKAELNAIENEYTEESKNHVSEVSWFKSHASYTEKIITLSSLTGTALFQRNISFLIKQTSDPTLYRILVAAAGNIGYDENYSMLNAIYVSLRNFSPDNEGIYLSVCDTVLSICQYMGQGAYDAWGSEILQTLRYSGYPTKIQQYASDTLSNIAKLKI